MKTRERRTGVLNEVIWLAAYITVAGWLFDQLIKLF